ncbi:MAG: HAMP domain-containing histidine kinase [Spirochaetes bacterium]|nr:HAMP domain-containing histidine kinase [Spirochaetota bacterium]
MASSKETKNNLYETEEEILSQALEICHNQEYSQSPLFAHFKVLTSSYRKILKMSKKLTRISDMLENYLSETLAELEEANELKSHLMDILVHDLKNPLSSIFGISQLIIKKTENNPELLEMGQLIYDSARKMNDMITGILEDTKKEHGKVKLNFCKVDLINIIFKSIQNMNISANNKKQKIHFDFNKSDQYEVNADSVVLEDIMDNLLSNAIKFSQYNKSIWIEAGRIKDNIYCSIKDEGPGFTEVDKNEIFKKYQKLSAKPTNNESSTGLGLYLIKKFIELHNGDIFLESEPGQGATFTVEFPAYQ